MRYGAEFTGKYLPKFRSGFLSLFSRSKTFKKSDIGQYSYLPAGLSSYPTIGFTITTAVSVYVTSRFHNLYDLNRHHNHCEKSCLTSRALSEKKIQFAVPGGIFVTQIRVQSTIQLVGKRQVARRKPKRREKF